MDENWSNSKSRKVLKSIFVKVVGLENARNCKDVVRTAKWKIFGKSEYGKLWGRLEPEWWLQESIRDKKVEEDLRKYILSKENIHTVLDIGCGAGAIPSRHKEMFSGMQYTGIDMSEAAIAHAKKNLPFEFKSGDFIKMENNKQYDLIFTLGVLDHVYDIDKFLTKTLDACKKYAYIHTYRGHFTELEEHRQWWNDGEGNYYNDISIPQVKKFLINYGLKEDEFSVRLLKGAMENLETQTVFEIEKKN